MKQKPLIPFSWMPGSWGLKGTTRDRAKAEYELDGYELEIALAKIDFNGKELETAILEIDYKHNKIDDEKYEAQKIEMMDDSKEKQLLAVESLLKFGHITDVEARKRHATISGEPFFDFDVVLVDGELEIEVEYNQLFVEHIRQFGYDDELESDAIDAYISDLGRKISQTEDEQLLDANDALDDQIIKAERDGEFTSYR
ncbi:hypothetical protein NVP2275O_485 [Vibrio phage 2.275.O._10N.286.54.E11]|nr:hypothetical protein NVP2275O_485 [Vibrio phage 2.275.O._10N.286.54.E11]